MQNLDLRDKKVLITGGSTGIGRTCAKLLSEQGCKVAIFGRDQVLVNEALADIGNNAIGFSADVSEQEGLDRIFQVVDEQLGGLDILINNAALGAHSVVSADINEIRQVIAINLVGYLACCHYAVPRMRAAGGGHVVNIGSMSAVERSANTDIYTATKSGIDGFTDAFRRQVIDDNIRVTLIEPGLVGTDMTSGDVPLQKQLDLQDRWEILRTEDIANAVVYALTQPLRCSVIHMRVQPTRERK